MAEQNKLLDAMRHQQIEAINQSNALLAEVLNQRPLPNGDGADVPIDPPGG